MIYKFVTIEGNIGAGKTTLANLLAQEYGGRLILEQFRENPFLAKFYGDQEKYAFQLEMSFMLDRYKQLNEILSEPNIFKSFTVTDYMFTKSLLFAKINLSSEEYYLYRHMFDAIYKKLPKPDIIVYLHADTAQLLKNIKKRGRTYEQNISKHYLNKIERVYLEYFKQNPDLKVVIANVNNIDWISDIFNYPQLLSLFDREYNQGINVVDLVDEAVYD